MFQTITPEEMRRIERRALEGGSVNAAILMERAALHVAEAAAPYLRYGGRLLAVCGPGNNGGDGLAAARLLLGWLPALRVTVWKLPGALSAECVAQWGWLETLMDRVTVETLVDGAPLPAWPKGTGCALDAMFGTGLRRPLSGTARAAAEALGRAGVPVVAVDIPSGLCGATGQTVGGSNGLAVRADVTVTFHRPKPGLFLGDGPGLCGHVTVGDIGLPPDADDAVGMAVLARGDPLLPTRARNTHKGDYGRVLALTGSFGMAGAAALCATAALRAGAGLVTVACPRAVVPTVQALCPCATCLPLPDGDMAGDPAAAAQEAWALLEPALARADALVAGCGLGRGAMASALLARLVPWLCAHTLPAVLDADALNWLDESPAFVAGEQAGAERLRLPEHIVLTPHPGEAARLLHTHAAAVTADPPAAARALRAAYGGAVALKGAGTVLAAADGEAVSPFGTPGMAKGGSGDALAGVLGALLAGGSTYGLTGVRRLQVACAMHGLAGMRAADAVGERGMLATDLCDALARVGDTVDRGAPSVSQPMGYGRYVRAEERRARRRRRSHATRSTGTGNPATRTSGAEQGTAAQNRADNAAHGAVATPGVASLEKGESAAHSAAATPGIAPLNLSDKTAQGRATTLGIAAYSAVDAARQSAKTPPGVSVPNAGSDTSRNADAQPGVAAPGGDAAAPQSTGQPPAAVFTQTPDAVRLGGPEEDDIPEPQPMKTYCGLAPWAALGCRVRVTVDRPLGSRHPEYRDTLYQLNYGYVADVLAADNEWQDAYVWGVREQLAVFEGEVVAVIHRLNDTEDKWVVALPGTAVTEEEVRRGTAFAERFFKVAVYVQKPSQS